MCFRGHYPGTTTSDEAKHSGKPLWASEDYSTRNDETGAGCMARVSQGGGSEGAGGGLRSNSGNIHIRCALPQY